MIAGKTLVTGATGFTGSHLCRRLLAEGEQVVAFTRTKSGELEQMGVECRTVDVRNREEVADNFAGVTRVFHIAAAYRTEHADTREFNAVNVEGTRNVLDAARQARVTRFVHCSTVGVQGEIKDPPADEDYRFEPGDHYQESKLQGELLAREYFNDGLPGVVVRPVGIYGPGDRRFLKLFRPINRGYFVMIGDGSTLYQLTYIDDLIEGFILAGDRPQALGRVFTIAGEPYTRIRELVDLIAEILRKPRPKLHIPLAPVHAAAALCETICKPLGISPPLYPRRVEFFAKDRAFTIERAKRELGYQPQIGLREGLTRTAAWYLEHGWL